MFGANVWGYIFRLDERSSAGSGLASSPPFAAVLLVGIGRQNIPQMFVVFVRGEVAKRRTHLAADEIPRSLGTAQ
jgi:hypothetical protein